MAANRLDKIGTIYSRVTGLLRAGAIKWEDKPVWYNIYRAFPPINEITYLSPKPETSIRNIFYTEDKIRAKFHNKVRNLSPLKLDDQSTVSECQSFIQEFKKIQKESNKSEYEAFREALTPFKKSASGSKSYQPSETEVDVEDLSASSEFRAALDESYTKTVDSDKLFADIFKKDK